MADDRIIYDATGAPLGTFRPNQDPEAPQRVVEIPLHDVSGEVSVNPDTGETITETVPLDYARAQSYLESEGLVHVGDGIILAADDAPADDADESDADEPNEG